MRAVAVVQYQASKPVGMQVALQIAMTAPQKTHLPLMEAATEQYRASKGALMPVDLQIVTTGHQKMDQMLRNVATVLPQHLVAARAAQWIAMTDLQKMDPALMEVAA